MRYVTERDSQDLLLQVQYLNRLCNDTLYGVVHEEHDTVWLEYYDKSVDVYEQLTEPMSKTALWRHMRLMTDAIEIATLPFKLKLKGAQDKLTDLAEYIEVE